MVILFNKNTVIGLAAVAAVVVSGSSLADNSYETGNPAGSQVYFTIMLRDNTCSASLSSPVVDFGNISRANFTGLITVGKTQTFELTLSGCREEWMRRAEVMFAGPGCTGTYAESVSGVATAHSWVLPNPSGEGNAKYVGIRLQAAYWSNGYTRQVQIRCISESSALEEGSRVVSSRPAAPTQDFTYHMTAEVIQTNTHYPTTGKLNASGTLIIAYY